MPTQSVLRRGQRQWSWGWDRYYCDGTVVSTPIVGIWGDYPNTIFRKERSWVRTPGFRTLVQQKKHLPDNAYGYQEDRVCDKEIPLHYNQTVGSGICAPGASNEYFRYYTDRVQTLYLAYSRGDRILSENALRAKLIDRAKGAEWSIPVFVGEGRETVNLVLNAARTVGSAYRDLRRGNLVGALASLGVQGTAAQRRRYHRQYGVDPTRAAANAWLSLTYGWQPLLNDAKNAAETLAEIVNSEQNREIRVTATTRLTTSTRYPNHGVSSSPDIKVLRTDINKESCKGVWRCRPTNWNNVGSLGILNPAQVAWELLPLSFVADWFLPIGRFLEGLDVPMRFQHLGGSIGYRREYQTLYEKAYYHGQGPQEFPYSTVCVTVERQPLTSAPTLGLSSIVFEPKLGSARVTSAISLLRQTMSR